MLPEFSLFASSLLFESCFLKIFSKINFCSFKSSISPYFLSAFEKINSKSLLSLNENFNFSLTFSKSCFNYI
ncbi:hypothetical protein Hanom_Chr03g00215061 [Helianthus anomalus]